MRATLPIYIRRARAAEMLGISADTLRRWEERGTNAEALPVIRFPGMRGVRYDLDDVARFAERLKAEARERASQAMVTHHQAIAALPFDGGPLPDLMSLPCPSLSLSTSPEDEHPASRQSIPSR